MTTRRRADDNRLLADIGQNNASAAEQLRKSVAALDAELDRVDAKLAYDFKQFSELSKPQPLSIAATQALLGAKEALVLFLDIRRIRRLREESLIFVVTKDSARWFSSELGTRALTRAVAALRCGLDQSLWTGGKDEDECTTFLHARPLEETVAGQAMRVLPFDLERAHALYRGLFGAAEDMIAGKDL